MDRTMIQTQHSSFEDTLTVHPLSLLQQKLHDDIDDDTLDNLIVRSKKHLTVEQYAEVTAGDEGRFLKWITALESNLGQRDSVEFITNILDSERVWDSEGAESWAVLMRQYSQECDQYDQRCAEQSLCKDGNFTGRETLIQHIIGVITSASDLKTGVVLCGEGGMGKTSVGDEVCHRLGNGQRPWKILICNQREKSDLRELLVDLITAFDPETVVEPGVSEEDLTMELAHLVTKSSDERRLVLIDNLDLQCDSEPKRWAVCGLLMDILTRIGRKQPLRILVTVGDMLTFDPGTRVEVVKLGPLTNEDTSVMLRKVNQLSDQDLPTSKCHRMRELCDGHPMVIRTVAALLQSACLMDDVILALQSHNDTSSLTNQQLEICIHKSLHLLVNDVSTKHLVKLLAAISLFQSAHFDISAVLAVGTVEKVHETRLREKMEQNLKVLNNHQLIEIDKMTLMIHKERQNQKSESHRRSISQTHGEPEECSYITQTREPESHRRSIAQLHGEPEECPYITQTREPEYRHVYSLHPLVFQYVKTSIEQSSELSDHRKEAQERFLQYFYTEVVKLGKLLDTEPVRAKQRIDQNVVHIKEFFRLLTADAKADTDIYISALTATNDKQTGRHSDTILEHKQIWKVAEFVLIAKSRQRQPFAKKQAELAKNLKHLYEYTHWTCLESEYLVMNDRCELAEQRIDALEEVLEIKAPESEGEGSADQLSASGWIENRSQRIPVVATLHVVKGRICKKRNMMEEALSHFRTARILFEGKQNIPNLIETKIDGKHIYKKNSYISELAQAENLMGEVYFELKQLKRAKDCYQKALDILTNKQEKNHRGAASIRANIGSCFYAEAQSKEGEDRNVCLEAARDMLSKSLQYHQHMKRGEANTLIAIADVHHLMARPEEALESAEQALVIFKRGVIHPNVDLTVTAFKVAFYHLQVDKSKGHTSEETKHHLSESVEQFDELLQHILRGGLPLDHRDGETYRHIKAYHEEAMSLMEYPERLIQQRMSQYEEFESGQRSKQIQSIKLQNHDFDARDFYDRVIAEGIPIVKIADSDADVSTVCEVGVRNSSNTLAVPDSKPNDEPALSVSNLRHDSSMDISEDVDMRGNEMDIDDNSSNVGAEMETDTDNSGKLSAMKNTELDKDAIRKVVDKEFGTIKPSESIERPVASKQWRLRRQTSFDLPTIPNIKNCSDMIDAMGNRTGSGSVGENAMKDDSEVGESVDFRNKDRKAGIRQTASRDRKVSFGSVTALGDNMDLRFTMTVGDRKLSSEYVTAQGENRDLRSTITVGDRTLSSESSSSQRDSVFSQGSHDDSPGTTDRLSVSSYDSGHGSCGSSSDEWGSRKSSISSIGTWRRRSWISGASSGSSEGSEFSMTSQESQESGSRSTKRKSWSSAGSQDSLTAQMRQLVFLTPKSFKHAKDHSSAAKKSRQERM